MQINGSSDLGFVGKTEPDGVPLSFQDIGNYAGFIADELTSKGISSGDCVALWLVKGQDKLAAILGCWMIGAVFCVLPSFAGNIKTERSQNRIESVFSVLKPKLLLQGTTDLLPPQAHAGVPSMTLSSFNDQTASRSDIRTAIAARKPDELAFIQFTSGSTGGKARGAEVRFGQLQANLDALTRRTELSASDHMVSWAPLYHDMGLMAVLLALRCGADLTLIETDHFVRRPSVWLEAISKGRGTITTGLYLVLGVMGV